MGVAMLVTFVDPRGFHFLEVQPAYNNISLTITTIANNNNNNNSHYAQLEGGGTLIVWALSLWWALDCIHLVLFFPLLGGACCFFGFSV